MKQYVKDVPTKEKNIFHRTICFKIISQLHKGNNNGWVKSYVFYNCIVLCSHKYSQRNSLSYIRMVRH